MEVRSGLGSRLRPLGSRLWIEDTSRASGQCGGYNSSNTHTTQGGVGHNNIASSTNQLDVRPKRNTGWHASPPDRLRASGGKDAKHGEEPRTRRAHRSNIMLACMHTHHRRSTIVHACTRSPSKSWVGRGCPSTPPVPKYRAEAQRLICHMPICLPHLSTRSDAIRNHRSVCDPSAAAAGCVSCGWPLPIRGRPGAHHGAHASGGLQDVPGQGLTMRARSLAVAAPCR